MVMYYNDNDKMHGHNIYYICFSKHVCDDNAKDILKTKQKLYIFYHNFEH